jgi:aspartate aminotransferase/aminotransferase
MSISKRALKIESSGIRRVFDLAAKLDSPINLSIGQPCFDAPEVLRKAAISAIESNKNGYTQTQGIAPLREKIFEKYGVSSSSSDHNVFVTGGVSGGLLLSYLAVLDVGDEVLIPDPYFCMYRDLANLISAVPVCYDTYPDFIQSASRIEPLITPKTKALVVNTPANPTGYAMSEGELKEIVELAKRHNLWLIYDEIYEFYCYDQPHPNAFGSYEKTIILNGFSKSHGVPGWRVGYAVGPRDVVDVMLKIQQYSFVCAPSMAQWGLVSGFDWDFSSTLVDYTKKRDYVYEELKNSYEVNKPGGAFYIFPKAPGGKGQEFVERCIKNSLLVVPGNVFSSKDSHFRISFSASMETLAKGVEVLKRLST